MKIEILMLAVFGIGALSGYLFNRHEWNAGICRKNGLRWRHFDTDSSGARGYVAGDQYCWISWPVDSARAKEDTRHA